MKHLLILICMLPSFAFSNPTPARLRHDLGFIFEKVLEMKYLTHDPKIPFPEIHFESKTALEYFQDIIESQWGFRPDKFSNAYAIHSNKIFILDDASYYNRLNRCMDDSVAHELVHYLQSKYQAWDMSDESLEWQAIDIQTTFREKYCPTSSR